MILTCPHCDTQFTLDAALLGDKGRKVKCSNCAEMWFQDAPDTPRGDDNAALDGDDKNTYGDGINDLDDALNQTQTIDDTPPDNVASEQSPTADMHEGIDNVDDSPPPAQDTPEDTPKDTPEDKHDTPPPSADADEHAPINPPIEHHPKAHIFAYIAAAVIFALLLLMLIVFRGGIMNAAPSTVALYNPLGMVDTRAAKGLVFDNVTLRRADDGGVTLGGNIVNISGDVLTIPPVQARILDGAETVLNTVYITPKTPTLNAESDTQIEHVFPTIDTTAARVDLRFVLHKDKTPSKDTSIDEHASAEKTHQTDAPHTKDNAHH